MYTLVNAFLREKNSEEPWKEVNIYNMLLSDIFNKYISGHIKLTNNYIANPLYLDLKEFKSMNIQTPNITFGLWLSYIGNKVITTNEIEPQYKQGNVTYCDAWQAGYKIIRMSNNLETENMVISDLPNLYMSKSGTSVNTLQDYTLSIVNGYLHFSEGFKNGMKIHGGGETITKSGNNQIGLISFFNVGKINQYKIDDSMIYPTKNNSSLSRGLFINLKKDISNKKVFVSILGHLIYDSKYISIVNDELGIIRLDIDSLDLPGKVLRSLKDLELNEGSLGISDSGNNSITRENILSDTSLKYFLNHYTSFVIVIDTDIITIEKKMVDNIGLFGIYEYHEKPILPMIDYYGRLPVYHFEPQGPKYILKTIPLYSSHYNYQTAEGDYNRITDAVAPTYTNKDIGHLLQISGYSKT